MSVTLYAVSHPHAAERNRLLVALEHVRGLARADVHDGDCASDCVAALDSAERHARACWEAEDNDVTTECNRLYDYLRDDEGYSHEMASRAVDDRASELWGSPL